ncbi:MAG: hypothetical protein M3P34_03880 [Actinomycetota bacterium]|nr:hypothetical protein [Actinomycetota bacterium]
MGFEREAAGLTVLRAACRRSRSDFVGTNGLLARLDVGLLDDVGRAAASREAAFAAADLASLEQVRFPRDATERARLIERVARGRAHLEAMVEADPGQFEAAVLLGLLAYCERDDAGAARHLGVASQGLAERAGTEELATAVRFHWGLSQLRLLEPGTDEGAYQVIEAAMDAGYVPGVDELVSAAVALEAHGSPYAGRFLRTVACVAPTDPSVSDLVAQRAKGGDQDAAAAAEQARW